MHLRKVMDSYKFLQTNDPAAQARIMQIFESIYIILQNSRHKHHLELEESSPNKMEYSCEDEACEYTETEYSDGL